MKPTNITFMKVGQWKQRNIWSLKTKSFLKKFEYPTKLIVILISSVADPDPNCMDPYHLARSGSVSNDTDPDPGSAKN